MMHRLLALMLLLVVAGQPAAAEEGPAEATRVGLVKVRADGPCRIPRTRLAELGIRDPYRLEVRRDGRRVPCYTHEEIGVDAEHVVFAARNTARPASAVAVYELWRLPQPRAVQAVPASGGMPLPRGLALDRYRGELGAADPATYDPGTRARPHWFLAVVMRRQAAEIPFGPYGAKPGTPQKLEVTVYGNWTDLATMRASWGDRDLGTVATPDPSRQHTLVWHVPADAVPSAEAPLVLRNTSKVPSAPVRNDVSTHRGTLYVDRVRLVGASEYIARWDRARVAQVEAVGTPADPLTAAGAAEHVILATPPLLEAAKRLAAHRTRTGTPSAVVPVTAVYDRFGYGQAGGEAIHRFVEALRARANAPLRYLLLAGDATYERTDISKDVTIPAHMAYTMYNGTTPSDVGYVAGADVHVGRLPFAQASEMDAFVDRVVRYETNPPLDPTRRMLRFVTSPGRFGALVDTILESRFKSVLSRRIPPAYDVAITYAHPTSPYRWPATTFSDHVIEEINAGSLFFTYVGHGFEKGFDSIIIGPQRHRILHVEHADRVDTRTMPPIVFVLACTTAMFDGLRGPGIGEALMRRPHGPIAYFGATRVCHPGYNALIGESIAGHMAKGGRDLRLGALLAAAQTEALDPTNRKIVRVAISQLGGAPSARIAAEGAKMYALLGDPALRVPIPAEPLEVTVARPGDSTTARQLSVTVRGDVPAGARVVVTLEASRTRKPELPYARGEAAPENHVRENHAAANRWVLARTTGTADEAGIAVVSLPLDAATRVASGQVVKAWIQTDDRVRYGAAVLE